MHPALASMADSLEAQARVLIEQARVLRVLGAQPAVERGPVGRTLSIREAADRMSASKGFVRALIAKGDLKVTHLSGRVVRVAEADLDSLVRRRSG